MARTTETPAEGMRRCIGSTKFGLPAHDAPITDFPSQPSQKDGLGRMCREHWTQYTRALRTGSIEPRQRADRPTEGERIVSAVDAAIAREARAAKSAAKAKPLPLLRTAKAKHATDPVQAAADAGDYVEATRLMAAADPEEDAILIERKARVKAHRDTTDPAATAGELYNAAKAAGRAG